MATILIKCEACQHEYFASVDETRDRVVVRCPRPECLTEQEVNRLWIEETLKAQKLNGLIDKVD